MTTALARTGELDRYMADLSTEDVQPFTEGQDFLDRPMPAFSAPAPVILGNVYLVRILDAFDPAFLRFAKLLVIEHETDRRVTFTWQEIKFE